MHKKYRGLSFAIPLLAIFISSKLFLHLRESFEIMILGAFVMSVIFTVGNYYRYKAK